LLTPYDPWLVWLVPIVGALVIPVIGHFTKSETSKRIRDIVAVVFSAAAVVFAVFMIPDASRVIDSQFEWFRLSAPGVVPAKVVSVGVLVHALLHRRNAPPSNVR
jgi:NADH:ubiquinone oxidoreductase subunit 5 (subunit L)/multisubunit Na+/H+ antiporter MnhA subunit